ncbi:MAG: hypothetical protein SPF41_02050 [Candidatus Merdousia sp.]|nr:hypothetical protein [Candidatus Merdousia sp.]
MKQTMPNVAKIGLRADTEARETAIFSRYGVYSAISATGKSPRQAEENFAQVAEW